MFVLGLGVINMSKAGFLPLGEVTLPVLHILKNYKIEDRIIT